MKSAVFFLLFVPAFACSAQPQPKAAPGTQEDVRKVQTILDSIRSTASPNEQIVGAALALLGTPYVAQTLEGAAEEALVVNLGELDCMTFVENCLALSRAAQQPSPGYAAFVHQLQTIRYRAGIVDGYPSRLHYTTDWISDNTAMGIVEDLTQSLGGERFRVRVGFMSSHPDRYPALKNNPANTKAMAAVEQTINARNTYYYLPKEKINDHQSSILSGDIVGFTTRIAGLDLSHLGIAYWKEGELRFIHASTTAMQVIINPTSISDYCQSISTCTGIVVLRAIALSH
jgi:cell wall-associated NlpC family hydrolase